MLLACPLVGVEVMVVLIMTDAVPENSRLSLSHTMDTTGRPPTTQERLAVPAV